MVFESIVADILNRYLGEYVENLDKGQLKIGIWGGKIVKNIFFRLSLKIEQEKSIFFPQPNFSLIVYKLHTMVLTLITSYE